MARRKSGSTERPVTHNVVHVDFQTRVRRPARSTGDRWVSWNDPQSTEEWLEYLDFCLDAEEEPVGLPADPFGTGQA